MSVSAQDVRETLEKIDLPDGGNLVSQDLIRALAGIFCA